MVAEMRDPETMRLTLSAAETGHRVAAPTHAARPDLPAVAASLTPPTPAQKAPKLEKKPASPPVPSPAKSAKRIEIEPMEGEFGKILKRPSEYAKKEFTMILESMKTPQV